VEGDGHLAGNDQSDDVAYRDDHATDHPAPLTKVMASSEIAYPARPVIAFPCPVKSPRKKRLKFIRRQLRHPNFTEKPAGVNRLAVIIPSAARRDANRGELVQTDWRTSRQALASVQMLAAHHG
jgi:hypothetical protein